MGSSEGFASQIHLFLISTATTLVQEHHLEPDDICGLQYVPGSNLELSNSSRNSTPSKFPKYELVTFIIIHFPGVYGGSLWT